MIGAFGGSVGGAIQHVKAGVVVGIIPSLVYNRLRDVALGQERVHRDNTTFQDQLL
jgi:hypothetical protein